MKKYIYHFTQDAAEGHMQMTDLLGGKGANLAQMCNIGLPIPPGFTISTELCKDFFETSENDLGEFDNLLSGLLEEAIITLEKSTSKIFTSNSNTDKLNQAKAPLLVSVRSGAKQSMPGMMDTILNLGINDEVVEKLAKHSENRRFALDSYRRFIEMYSSVVLEIPSYIFEEALEDIKADNQITNDQDLNESLLSALVNKYKEIVLNHTGLPFEQDPKIQLINAVKSVFKSWNSPRAIAYRKINNIKDSLGTAVNIQSMVFGNLGETSATGVVFTRNPVTGHNELFGEYLINAQGEDVVAGIRTPAPINKDKNTSGNSMEETLSMNYQELKDICMRLEAYFKDMQDIEFTIENGKLYILQTRSGKRSTAAAIKIAVDMTKSGDITKEEALLKIDPETINQLLHTAVDYNSVVKDAEENNQNNNKAQIIATGLPASPGAAIGIAVFSPYDAEELSHHHKVILIRNDTSPEDIQGMHLSKAIVTARGGMTSHAAVVARGMGCPCVCGVKGLTVNEKDKYFTTSSGHRINQGDMIAIDGASGNIIIGDVKLIEPTFSEEFNLFLEWADEIKNLKVRTNAETAVDSLAAIKFGAEGIGLCRTEHMFFDNEKIPLVRKMIVAPGIEHKMQATEALKPLQIRDFKTLFKVMDGKPVNIRLLDPPLHEFLPKEAAQIELLADDMGVAVSVIEHRLHALHELNPMLGHRGCRLGITNPEIYLMQVDAIISAISALHKEEGIVSNLELMIPLISSCSELRQIKSYVLEEIEKMQQETGQIFPIKIGTMIELPRACLLAEDIAKEVDYFSFGTNDLTQTTYGISRDDIGSFLPDYLSKGIMDKDPFIQIDKSGVGELMEIAVNRGKKGNKSLSFGICGEHAGDPYSIELFDSLGLDYVSCSPYRVPIARVAAAQTAIKQKLGNH